MILFDSAHVCDLKNFIYNSLIHDAFISDIAFLPQNSITFIAVNHIHNKQYRFVFENIHWFNYLKGDWHGENQQISSLTVEDCIPYQQEKPDNSIILLFQMFSGSEFYIVCDTVTAEETSVII